MDFRSALMSPPDCRFLNALAKISLQIGSALQGALLNDFYAEPLVDRRDFVCSELIAGKRKANKRGGCREESSRAVGV